MNYSNMVIELLFTFPLIGFSVIFITSDNGSENGGWTLLKIILIISIIVKFYNYYIVSPWRKGEKVGVRCVLFLLAQLAIISTFLILREYRVIFS